MNDKQQTELHENNGRNLFNGFVSTQNNWSIKKWSKNRFSSWDVSLTTGTTADFVITEIKTVPNYDKDQFSSWILEQKKLKRLQELKAEMQRKHPNKTIYIHYVNFYKDATQPPRIWDITNLQDAGVFKYFPINSNTDNPEYITKNVIYLNNNDAINL